MCGKKLKVIKFAVQFVLFPPSPPPPPAALRPVLNLVHSGSTSYNGHDPNTHHVRHILRCGIRRVGGRALSGARCGYWLARLLGLLRLGLHTIFVVERVHAFFGERVAGFERPEFLVVSTTLDVVAEAGCRKQSNEKTEEGDKSEGLHMFGCAVLLWVFCWR